MNPMPPMPCSIDRHSKMPGGASSRPTSTVEPVVVRPDIASKKASAGPSLNSDEYISGTAAASADDNHSPVVSRNP